MSMRFNQGSRMLSEVAVQPRPTYAEKVGRLQAPCLLASPNLLTSSNLNARTRARTRVYTRAHARASVRIQVRWVRRLDSNLIQLIFFRPTKKRRLDGSLEVRRGHD